MFLRLVHTAAGDALIEQLLRISLTLFGRLQGNVLQNDVNSGHRGHVGDTLPHHPGAEYAELIDRLLFDTIRPVCATVHLVKLEEKRRDHVLGDRRANQVGECA